MKISISESSLWRTYFPEKEYYPHIRQCGFEYIDYDYYDFIGDDTSEYLGEHGLDHAKEMRDYLDSLGITPLQAHAPKGEPTQDREGILRRTKRTIECCKIMGVKNLVYHTGAVPGMSRKEYMDFNVAYVRELLPLLEKNEICLCTENIGRWDEPYIARTASELLEMIEMVDHPLYQACLDTGHMSLEDGNMYETIVALGSHLRCLHVQDNYGSLSIPAVNGAWRQDLHLPPLMGKVNFDEIMLALKRIGYTGTFNMEPEAPRTRGLNQKYSKPLLRVIPLELCMEYYTWVHDVAEYILNAYDMNG